MKITFTLILLVVVLALTSNMTSVARNEDRPAGVLAALRPEQTVNVKEAGGRFEISVIPGLNGGMGFKVVEVGSDYLVVLDGAGIAERRIPIYSISSVTVMRGLGR